MRVLLAGASGLLGSAVSAALLARGDAVVRTSRFPKKEPDNQFITWEEINKAESNTLTGIDAVIDFAGSPIGERRLTRRRKVRIASSRADSLTALGKCILLAESPPHTLLYANNLLGLPSCKGGTDQNLRPASDLDDTTAWDNTTYFGYLGSLLDEIADELRTAMPQLRCVSLRFADVLDANKGSLAHQSFLYRAGLGGRIADGTQWYSWIHIDDATRAVLAVLDNRTIPHNVNICSPYPIQQRDVNLLLGHALRRPTPIPISKAFLVVALGLLYATEVSFASRRCTPNALLHADFCFTYPHYIEAIAELLRDNSQDFVIEMFALLKETHARSN